MIYAVYYTKQDNGSVIFEQKNRTGVSGLSQEPGGQRTDAGDAEIEGYEIVSEAEDADIIIINTCGFIESAKRVDKHDP